MPPRSTAEAPGLSYRRGVPYWIAPTKAVKRGYTPKTVRLAHCLTDAELADACRRHYREALEFLGFGDRPRVMFDGTLGSLIEIYQTHRISPFHRVKWNTRDGYVTHLRTLKTMVGGKRLGKLTGEDFHDWYWGSETKDGFRSPAFEGGPERATQAHHIMNMLRMVLAFGVVALERVPAAECARLAGILGKMSFPSGQVRQAFVTADMVHDFSIVAHERGRPSMALAFALQFETGLRQRDVIGEMTPDAAVEPGPLSVRGRRWTTGLIWGEHIDRETLLVAKPTSKSRGKKIAVCDLRLCPLALAEIERIPRDRRVGPVIISEKTGKPYDFESFRRLWRRIADDAGIPQGVKNMHARHGAENEAKLAGAHPMHIRNMMTHSDLKTTLGYDQATLDETRNVAELRSRMRGR